MKNKHRKKDVVLILAKGIPDKDKRHKRKKAHMQPEFKSERMLERIPRMMIMWRSKLV